MKNTAEKYMDPVAVRHGLSEEGNQIYLQALLKKDRESYEYLMKDPKGRWFFSRLCEQSFISCTTFTGNSHSFFYEGIRKAALDLIDCMKTASFDLHRDVIQAEIEVLGEKENLASYAKNKERMSE